MRRVLAFVLAVLLAPVLSAQAQSTEDRLSQVALLPLAGRPADVEALARAYWGDYLGRDGEHGFDLDQVLAGRYDLDGDGEAEIFLMIDQPNWQAAHGKPFVVARWGRGRWVPVGWGWGDEEAVYVTAERRSGWHTIDAGPHFLRWLGHQYGPVEKE